MMSSTMMIIFFLITFGHSSVTEQDLASGLIPGGEGEVILMDVTATTKKFEKEHSMKARHYSYDLTEQTLQFGSIPGSESDVIHMDLAEKVDLEDGSQSE